MEKVVAELFKDKEISLSYVLLKVLIFPDFFFSLQFDDFFDLFFCFLVFKSLWKGEIKISEDLKFPFFWNDQQNVRQLQKLVVHHFE